jgi:hypothetical protein
MMTAGRPTSPCVTSVSSLVSLLASSPFNSVARALLRPLQALLGSLPLSLPKRTPVAFTQPSDDLSGPFPDDPDHYDDDFWLDYLSNSSVQHNCILYLERCIKLDPAKHSH